MVESLLRIPGINKDAVNQEGLTALDIARENTEYHEPYRIIQRLGNYPPNRKPFLYSAPKVSSQKLENTIIMVNKIFEDRQNIELVVAVLLATMSFTAAFTIPGGFRTEVEKGEEHSLGTALLIRSLSFKMFIIFDCAAFFLSLFAVLAWQITTPLTPEHKLSFLNITNLCLNHLRFHGCSVYNACAQYHGLFLVKRVRVKHLCGVNLIVYERLVEYVWMKLEGQGLMELMRRCKTKCLVLLYGHRLRKDGAKSKRGSDEIV
ncbi:hypothetical protein SUGI_0697410 [Cryptomeria japonica]|nr:hypothetical protein SUGI_0697410 [Cryptomeria japonica]